MARKSVVSTVIPFAPKSDEQTVNEIYQGAYRKYFSTKTLNEQMEVIKNLGKELGDINTILMLPDELMKEIIGAAVITTHTQKSASEKWFYHRKLTEVYDYIIRKQKEEESKVVNITKQGETNGKTH